MIARGFFLMTRTGCSICAFQDSNGYIQMLPNKDACIIALALGLLFILACIAYVVPSDDTNLWKDRHLEYQALRHETEGLEKAIADAETKEKVLLAKVEVLRKQLAFCKATDENHTSKVSLSDRIDDFLWLVICIPTVPRPGDDAAKASESPLGRVLASYASQIGQAHMSHIHVVVHNGRPGRHAVFDRLRQLYAQAGWVSFKEADEPTDSGRMLALLRHVQGTSRFYLFTEDDFELCSNGVTALTYFIGRAMDYQGTFSALRCGIGLNGIILQNGADGLMNDVKAITLLPENHTMSFNELVLQFVTSSTPKGKNHFDWREPMTFKYNLFHRVESSASPFRNCLTPLTSFTGGNFFSGLADVYFDATACPTDDVSPCKFLSAKSTAVDWSNA